jgi:rhomboid family protein
VIPVKDVIPPRRRPAVALTILTVATASSVVWIATERPSAGRIFYLAFNALYLWAFADNVEDRLGHVRFGVLYLLCHAAGSMARLAIDPVSRVPFGLTSGAVAGVLGAYFVLYPRSRVLAFLPFPLGLFEVPAAFFLGFFWIVHLTGGLDLVVEIIAGALAGAVLGALLRRPIVW